MKISRIILTLFSICASAAMAQTAANVPTTRSTARPPAPLRDPHSPGYVQATELPDGQVPPIDADGNFIIGRTHKPAPEMSLEPGAVMGDIYTFTLTSTGSKFYPGIEKGTPDPNNPTAITSHPAPWKRKVSVYVPKEYVAGSVAPFMITCDGDNRAFNVLANLIPKKLVPVMIVVAIQNGGGDGQGSERGLEYDNMTDRYSNFVEDEVLPMAEKTAHVTLTKDPDGRAVMGTSSGGSCALIMAWFHPERYHRVLTFSGTFVNQEWPADPQYPHGAWGFHETLIPNSSVKPLRIFMECGDRDNYRASDGMHDWVQANENMAKVLADKGYHYKFVFARNAGHTDRPTIGQLYPGALQWLWQGYPIDGK